MDIIQALKEELQIGRNQVEAAVKLIDEGNTIPFIARYRKEATGSLNDEVLRQLDERLRYLRNLEDKKEQVIGAIRAQEKLTPALEKQIRDVATLVAVEDLYLPYRPKRRTRAGIAREKGLEPLAVWIYKQEAGGSLEAEAAKYVSEVCMQYNLGVQYDYEGRFCKAELYYKDYDRLALEETDADTKAVFLTSNGYGHSKGIDLFFRDRASFKNLEYQLSYTYNIAKRKYREYLELTTPQYATRHNAAWVVKYSLPRLRSIVSVTDRFSSGRPYHNSMLPGLMNDEVKPYNSLDLGVTFLASKKVIIHASTSNILCRKNEFGKVDNKAVLASSDHFFYVGVYVTLGKKAAYDVSNF